jgi:putative NADH-flavin reductase
MRPRHWSLRFYITPAPFWPLGTRRSHRHLPHQRRHPPTDTEGQPGATSGPDFATAVIDVIETPTHRR